MIGDDDIGLAMSGREFSADLRAKIPATVALGIGLCGNILRGSTPPTRAPRALVAFEQRRKSVIRSDLENEGRLVRRLRMTAQQIVGLRSQVVAHDARGAGHVKIPREQRAGINDIAVEPYMLACRGRASAAAGNAASACRAPQPQSAHWPAVGVNRSTSTISGEPHRRQHFSSFTSAAGASASRLLEITVVGHAH